MCRRLFISMIFFFLEKTAIRLRKSITVYFFFKLWWLRYDAKASKKIHWSGDKMDQTLYVDIKWARRRHCTFNNIFFKKRAFQVIFSTEEIHASCWWQSLCREVALPSQSHEEKLLWNKTKIKKKSTPKVIIK